MSVYMDEITRKLVRELMERISLVKHPKKFEQEDFVRFCQSHEYQIKWVEKNNNDIKLKMNNNQKIFNYENVPSLVGEYLNRTMVLDVDNVVKRFLDIYKNYTTFSNNSAISQFFEKYKQYLKSMQSDDSIKTEPSMDQSDSVELSMDRPDSVESELFYSTLKCVDPSSSSKVDPLKSPCHQIPSSKDIKNDQSLARPKTPLLENNQGYTSSIF